MKKILSILTFTLFCINAFAQNVKVMDSPSGTVISNIGGTDIPYSSSILDIRSTNKAILLPRMPTASRDAITSPIAGMLLYNNTTNQFNFHDGAAWQQLYLGNQWNINGSTISYSGGRVGVGTTAPLARMAVDSSLMIDQSNSNQGFLDNGALYFGNDKWVGIVRSYLTGSNGRSGMGFFTGNTRRMTIDSTGQIGIGTINPLQALHVVGNTYLNGYVGIGSSTPDYAFENLYGYNYMFYGLGIGTIPNSTYLLDVGTVASRFQGDVRFNGIVNPNNALTIGNNTTVEGTLTVNGGKGVAYNPSSATNLKIVPFTTATFVAVLGPHDISAEGSIGIPGGFTNTPKVFVGDIDVTGGTTGQLYMVELQLYGCTPTSCKARLVNRSAGSVNYSITWNCVAIGN